MFFFLSLSVLIRRSVTFNSWSEISSRWFLLLYEIILLSSLPWQNERRIACNIVHLPCVVHMSHFAFCYIFSQKSKAHKCTLSRSFGDTWSWMESHGGQQRAFLIWAVLFPRDLIWSESETWQSEITRGTKYTLLPLSFSLSLVFAVFLSLSFYLIHLVHSPYYSAFSLSTCMTMTKALFWIFSGSVCGCCMGRSCRLSPVRFSPWWIAGSVHYNNSRDIYQMIIHASAQVTGALYVWHVPYGCILYSVAFQLISVVFSCLSFSVPRIMSGYTATLTNINHLMESETINP